MHTSPRTCPLQARGDTGPPAKDQQPEEQTLVPQPGYPGSPQQTPGQSQLSAWELLLKTMKETMEHGNPVPI